MKNRIINLFSNCLPVKGASRSIICDLQRQTFFFVPNSLADIFLESPALDHLDFESQLDEESFIVFKEYLQLLGKNDMIFYSTKKESDYFPELSMEWDFPSQITNIIIDFNVDAGISFLEIILKQLDEINCRFIQLRTFDAMPINMWNQLSKIIRTSEIKSIEIIAKDDVDIIINKDIVAIIQENKKISSVYLHSSKKNKKFNEKDFQSLNLTTVKQKIDSAAHCGNIHHSNFSVNIKTFSESLVHNTCLNRKIGIDINGDIKNCPSMKESYGNIKDTALAEAIEKPGFKKYWNITKDQVTKCKDCEFRHICTDCRAYLDNPEDFYSAPLKCGYDPYTCEWEDWSSHPIKQKAIKYYNF